jgi:hypothetical protein
MWYRKYKHDFYPFSFEYPLSMRLKLCNKKSRGLIAHGFLGNRLFYGTSDDLKTMGWQPLVKGATARVPKAWSAD